MAELTVKTNNEQQDLQEQTHEPERFRTPVVDIYEEDGGLRVIAEMPGLERDGIAVSVEKDILTLKGTSPRESVDREYAYREFAPTSYFRQFRLGNKIDQAKIGANYKHGVLDVRLPFAEETKPRQIEVAVG